MDNAWHGQVAWRGLYTTRAAQPAGGDFLPGHAPAALPRECQMHGRWDGGVGLPSLQSSLPAWGCPCCPSVCGPWALLPLPL